MRGKFWHMYKAVTFFDLLRYGSVNLAETLTEEKNALHFLDFLRYGSVDLAETLAKGEKAIAFS